MDEAERRALYERIAGEYRKIHDGTRWGELDANGELGAGIAEAIWDYVALQEIKEAYGADIAARGVIETVNNGRQKFRRENKSVAAMAKVMAEQLKLLKAIGLIRSGRTHNGALGNGDGEEDDEGNEFDAY